MACYLLRIRLLNFDFVNGELSNNRAPAPSGPCSRRVCTDEVSVTIVH